MRSLATLLLVLAMPALALADGELSDDELRALEEALQADTSPAPAPAPAPARVRAVQSANPNLSIILDVAAAYYSEQDSLQLGSHDAVSTGFNLQQLEMHFDASVDPYFRADVNLVFALFGVELEEAYATTLGLPAGFQLRIGQFLTRFGRANPTHPHAWSFADQALVLGKFFGGEGSRGLGVEASWLTPLPWYVEVLASVNTAAGECCARSFYGGEDPGTDGFEDLLVTSALKQFFDLSRDWALLWGLSGQFGPNANGYASRTNIFGTDLLLRFRPVGSPNRTAVELQLEALYRSRQVPSDVLQDAGLYGQVIYRINPRWEVGLRHEWVQGVEEDPLDPEWESPRSRTSAQTTFYPSHFSRFRLQGKYDRPEWQERPIWGATLAAEFMIGAHGAHSY